MGKSSPAPIDYEGAAIAEGEAAKEVTTQQTWANRPTQINPWGMVSWDAQKAIDPATGKPVTQWTQEQELHPYLFNSDPEINSALEYQMQLQYGRSALGAGMMEGLASQYYTLDEEGNPVYNAPNLGMFGGPMMASTYGMPELWGQLQWDLPQYTTTGQVRQLDFGGAPQITAPQYGVPRAEQAFYQRGASRLDPQQASEQQSLEIKMRNQGLTPGDEAWKSQMQDLNQRQNDARQALMNETIMAGGREAERMFGMESGYRGQITDELMGLGQFANQAAMNEFQQNMAAGTQQWKNVQQAAQFQNQARQQKWQERQAEANYYNQLRQAQMNEYLTQRGFTLNEIQALLNNQQVGMPQFNQFTNASKADTPQLLQAAMLQGQQNAANSSQENAWMNSLMGGAGQAAGMFAMFSDRRLKTNIRKIGERKGVNWYAYEIFGRPQIGVMADEVPWAAIKHPSGYYAVDYARI